MFDPGKSSQLSLMFTSKSGAYLSDLLLGRLPDLPTNLRRASNDKHSSLLGAFINYSHKIITLGPDQLITKGKSFTVKTPQHLKLAKARVFDPGKSSQLSLMLTSKAGAYLSYPLLGRLPDLPTNLRLVQQGLQVAY